MSRIKVANQNRLHYSVDIQWRVGLVQMKKMPHGDKVRTLAYATENPIQVSPEVPTFKSYGYPLYSSVFHGVGVPKGTPEEHIKVLEEAFL